MSAASEGSPTGRNLVIPLFIPHLGCPHRCIFCNQHAVTGQSSRMPTTERIRREISCFLKYAKRRPSSTQIAYYGGSFLGLGKSRIRTLLRTADNFIQAGHVDSIRFSTRPDTVTEAALRLLDGFSVSTVELGVQSMRDRILDITERGHRASDTSDAVDLLKMGGYQVGLQMMVGLPGDDDAGAMQTARRMVALGPDFVRIYPTLVLRGSPLADWFRTGRYSPMALEACVSMVKRIYLFFKRHRIPVIRMGLQASDGLAALGDLLAGPYHPSFGHLVHAQIAYETISSTLRTMAAAPDPLIIHCHPRTISRVQGLHKNNLVRLRQAFGLKKITLVQVADLEADRLIVGGEAIGIGQ